MSELKLDQLQTLLDVLELGSFSAAARRLRLTQPAISLQIKQLEERFGVRLIERIGKKAYPTAAALDLKKHVQQIREAVRQAENAMARHREAGIGRVRLGTGATASTYLLPPVLRDLRTRHPSIEITVSTGNTREILRHLEENALDAALVTLPAPGRALEIMSVIDDELLAVFPPDYPRIPGRATASALFDLPLILYESSGHTRNVIDGWFLRSRLVPKPIMELGSVEATKKLVSAGLGCAILPRLAVAEPQAAEGLQVRSLSPRLYRKLGLVMRRDKLLDPSLRKVVQALTNLAGKEKRRGGVVDRLKR